MVTDPVAPSHLLRLHRNSRLAFGATTAALVTLASGGTAVLVNHGASGLSSATSLPQGGLLPDGGSAGSVVLDPPVVSAPDTVVRAVVPDDTERALRAALNQRTQPGRRTLTVPLVALLIPDAPSLPPVTVPVARSVVRVTVPLVSPVAPGPDPSGAPTAPYGGSLRHQTPPPTADDRGPGHSHVHDTGHDKGHDKGHGKKGKHAKPAGRAGRHAR